MLENSFCRSLTDLEDGTESVRQARYGMIEIADGRLARVRLRLWPKLISVPEIRLLGRIFHRFRSGNRCWLYYAQPRRFPNFLTVQYMVSTRAASYRSFLKALEVLDRVAELKKSDAILCELIGNRISREMMARWGWEPHCLESRRRHYIKRLYESL